jgi:uncharacterized protein
MSIVEHAHESRQRLSLRLDPVWAMVGGILGMLAIFNPGQAQDSIAFVIRAVASVAPLFLLSLSLLAFTTASGADNLISKAFVGRRSTMIILAALMGALSPFCSCGVIPLIAALLHMGVPLPAVMAFWLASPLMDPAQFLLTASVLGFPFAVAKTVAAIGVGLLGGFGVAALQSMNGVTPTLRESVGNGGCAGGKVRNPKAVVWAFWREPERVRKAASTMRTTGLFLGKMLILAFVLESLMSAWMPSGFIGRVLGGEGLLPIVTATLIGIPAYLNGTAALPLIRELMHQGMAPGAAMAFLIAGGVTSIPAAIAVWSIARPTVFAVYLALAALGAILSGLAWQAVQLLL